MDERKIGQSLKHEQLKDILADSINNGSFKPGDRIPSQNELAEVYGMSHSTVRESLASLVNEGLLYRIQGKGTFVSEKKIKNINIALILPSLFSSGRWTHTSGDDITSKIANGVEEEARKNNAGVMLYLDQDQAEIEKMNLQLVPVRKSDAAVLFYLGGHQNLNELKDLQQTGIPIVLVDRPIDGMDFDYVISDNFQGAYKAVKELINMGFKKIYHFSVNLDRTWSNSRLNGYLSALKENGLDPEIYLVEPYEPLINIDGVLHNPSDVIGNFKPPYAVFADNAPIMSIVWNSIIQSKIPFNQFAIAGFDEPYIDFPTDANIVKIIQQLEEIGRESIRIIMKKLNGDTNKYMILKEPQIKIKRSLHKKISKNQ